MQLGVFWVFDKGMLFKKQNIKDIGLVFDSIDSDLGFLEEWKEFLNFKLQSDEEHEIPREKVVYEPE